jgi:hypothetical protein
LNNKKPPLAAWKLVCKFKKKGGLRVIKLRLQNEALLDERLGPDLPRGRGKSICEDFDVDDEGSEQNFEPLQSLHHRSVGYQSVRHELTSPRGLIPSSVIENTSKNKEEYN